MRPLCSHSEPTRYIHDSLICTPTPSLRMQPSPFERGAGELTAMLYPGTGNGELQGSTFLSPKVKHVTGRRASAFSVLAALPSSSRRVAWTSMHGDDIVRTPARVAPALATSDVHSDRFQAYSPPRPSDPRRPCPLSICFRYSTRTCQRRRRDFATSTNTGTCVSPKAMFVR